MSEENAADLIARGDTLMREGDFDAAIEAYRRAFELSPHERRCRDRVFTALVRRGERASQQEGAAEARRYYLRAKEYYPGDRQLRERLLALEAELGALPAPPQVPTSYRVAAFALLFYGVELTWFGLLHVLWLPMGLNPVEIVPAGLALILLAYLLHQKKPLAYVVALLVTVGVGFAFGMGYLAAPPFTDIFATASVLCLLWPSVPRYAWSLHRYYQEERAVLK